MKRFNMLALIAAVLPCLFVYSGCADAPDKTDYSKPYNATERRNEAFRKASIESIAKDRRDEAAYQKQHP